MNWFKYRLPNTTEIISGASDSLVEGIGKGFVIAPFLNPSENILTIPFDCIPDVNEIKPIESFLPSTTPQSDYFSEINAIKEDLKGKRGKTVAARVVNKNIKVDINDTFNSLCSSYPDAFVFAFSSSASGTWIGATPELLLKIDDLKISTMALAGTREISSDSNSSDWDEKNIEEQSMVVDFIKDYLIECSKNVIVASTYTKKAGNIEHICTPISAILVDESENALKTLLCRLSPTPAICGNDRKRSLELINDFENFNREYYGGFCGPNLIGDDSSFYVILRAAKINDTSISVFAGGGITRLSIPTDEWNETELKLKTIINKLKFLEE